MKKEIKRLKKRLKEINIEIFSDEEIEIIKSYIFFKNINKNKHPCDYDYITPWEEYMLRVLMESGSVKNVPLTHKKILVVLKNIKVIIKYKAFWDDNVKIILNTNIVNVNYILPLLDKKIEEVEKSFTEYEHKEAFHKYMDKQIENNKDKMLEFWDNGVDFGTIIKTPDYSDLKKANTEAWEIYERSIKRERKKKIKKFFNLFKI